METAIQIVWTIGLIGALIATGVILLQVALVVRVLQQILTVAEHTRKAARGVAGNMLAVSSLEGVEDPARRLREGTAAIAGAAAAIERWLDSILGRGA